MCVDSLDCRISALLMARSNVMRTFFLIFFIGSCFIGLCPAAPQPAVIQKPDDWTLDVRFEDLAQFNIELNGRQKRFWYMIITLTNRTGSDADFYPKCDLMTDTFEFVPAGCDVPGTVFEQIKLRHRSRYPFLESLEQAGSKVLQGEDNSKDIAIIWPDFDPNAKNVKLFIAGLSNEIAVVAHPVEKGKSGQPKKILLWKTLELNYSLAGDPAFRSDARLTFNSKRWIMR